MLIDGKEVDPVRRDDIKDQWHGAAARYGWLWPGVLVLAIIFLAFDLLPGRLAIRGGASGWIAVALQLAVLILFVIIVRGAARKYSWWLQLFLYLLILASGVLLLSPEYRVL